MTKFLLIKQIDN